MRHWAMWHWAMWHWRSPLLRALGRARRGRNADVLADERGVAALELALTLPLLAALLLGAADVALTAARARQVEELVETAGKAVIGKAAELLPPLRDSMQQPGLAIGSGQQPGLAGLQPLPSIVLATLVEIPPDVSSRLRLFRGCAGEAGIGAAAGPRCADGSQPAAYAEIEMSAPVERLVDWPGGLLPPSVSARSVVRLD